LAADPAARNAAQRRVVSAAARFSARSRREARCYVLCRVSRSLRLGLEPRVDGGRPPWER
jgi:hypothetical protein